MKGGIPPCTLIISNIAAEELGLLWQTVVSFSMSSEDGSDSTLICTMFDVVRSHPFPS